MATMMTLGGYTFTLNPEKCTKPLKEKRSSAVKTLGGVTYFSWGTYIQGQQAILEWKFCHVAQFSQFETLNNNNAQIVWNPGGGTSYYVEILKLEGKYFIDQTAGATHRGDVKLTLVIMSEV